MQNWPLFQGPQRKSRKFVCEGLVPVSFWKSLLCFNPPPFGGWRSYVLNRLTGNYTKHRDGGANTHQTCFSLPSEQPSSSCANGDLDACCPPDACGISSAASSESGARCAPWSPRACLYNGAGALWSARVHPAVHPFLSPQLHLLGFFSHYCIGVGQSWLP